MSGAEPPRAAGDEEFSAWWARRRVDGPLAAEEIVRALCPLLRQVAATHELGLVAPLVGLRSLRVADGALFYAAIDAAAPRLVPAALARVEGSDDGAIEVTARRLVDTSGAVPVMRSRDLLAPGEVPTAPAFLPGYLAWEHALEHQDALTDLFSLGLLLATLALGLDLAEDGDLQSFIASRSNPFALNPRLHPVVARLLVRMTEPRRARRAQDLAGLTTLLANHRDQAHLAWPLDLAGAAGAPRSRRQRIHERLRDRLFDCSRRNRLLHYKPTQAHLNLTVASVPLLLDVTAIRPDDLCTWQGAFAAGVLGGGAVNLGRWLRTEDAPYVPGTLDRIRVDEKRDRAEYGASQLRLVVAFLRWHDLKEDRDERITSPLLLLPVAVERRKGVRDSWTLTAAGSEAEVNPAMRHHLRQLYGLDLPESIDLAETPIAAFQARLQDAIQASEPGVTLRLQDRPRIDLVLQRARARADHHRRRARLTGRGVRRHDDIDYSYDPDNFQPLGLQIYLRRVKPTQLPLATIAGDRPRPRAAHVVAPAPGGDVRARESFVLHQDQEGNPYAWDLDICNLTLGNFNYRKMSLVRDYRALLERDAAQPAFDAVFAEHARPIDEAAPETADPGLLWTVVPSDPTQDAAVGRARGAASYVIQGPPGTGKSQTITNLIADQVARGRRVLFVCAKRAALDVVHHRLAQRGLDRLCCLIHDSQEDKKPFIHGLRSTYEDWLARPDELAGHRAERASILADLRSAVEPLERHAHAMLETGPQDGLCLRGIVGRLVALAGCAPADQAEDRAALPSYAQWQRFSPAIHALAASLRATGRAPLLATLGVRLVAPAWFREDRPAQGIAQALEACAAALAALGATLAATGVTDLLATAPLAETAALVADAARLLPLAERGLARLIDRADPGHAELRGALQRRRDLAEALATAMAATSHWNDPLPEADCAAALEQARALESGALRFLRPAWWRLRRVLRTRYRFDAHAVPPRWSAVIAQLAARHAAAAALAAADRATAAAWKVDDLQALAEQLAALHDDAAAPPAVAQQRERVRAGAVGVAALVALAGAAGAVRAAEERCAALLSRWRERSAAELGGDLAELRRDLPLLAHLLPALRALVDAPAPLWAALRDRPWPPEALEAAILAAAVAAAERRDPALAGLGGGTLAAAAARLRGLQRALLDANAQLVLAETHARFAERARRCGAPGAPGAGEREWRRRYARGRRELEHEFGKVMRHRSIRDLADDETGLVVADLKPIWLMSPLSVSDTLPLERSGFDVVIFDEASQIPIEEAVPALCRAPQAIVVGDRQQLPPTTFFATGGGEEELAPAEEDEAARIDLEHDSFLTQAAANLPGTMLGWHYRSRSAALIAFSNAAFYDGRLLTIPDAALPHRGQATVIADPLQGGALVEQVLERPLSFHRLAASPYLGRRNPGEAVHIAQLLRGLLARGSRLSIGIVAFSEAQQGAIEEAIQALTQEDAIFRERLEAEAQREEDGQFCGLFVKNLENVQGDERDLIILSICYGPDRDGRMLMNFGPINQSGGEKRLNVVFSRARRHMVVVASITADAITNVYNTGANTLKAYLAYAAAAAAGEQALAARILAGFAAGPDGGSPPAADPVAEAVAAFLRARGWLVDTGVGSAHFRCALAVRCEGDTTYRLGILIDQEHDYRALPPWERELARPVILEVFGWRVLRVRAMAWWGEPEKTAEGLLAALA